MNIDIGKNTLQEIQKELKKKGRDKFTLGFLIGDRIDNRIGITDILIPKQENDIYSSTIPEKETVKSLYKMMASQQQCVGIAVYQPSFGLYLSETSKVMMEELVKTSGQSMACLICNDKSKKVLWKIF